MKEIKTTRDASLQQETNVAKALGGHRTANSGATTFSKGDVIVGDCIVECKTKMTETNSFSVQKEWLDKLEKERQEMGKSAASLAISFDVGKHSYYIINEKLMKMLLEVVNTKIE